MSGTAGRGGHEDRGRDGGGEGRLRRPVGRGADQGARCQDRRAGSGWLQGHRDHPLSGGDAVRRGAVQALHLSQVLRRPPGLGARRSRVDLRRRSRQLQLPALCDGCELPARLRERQAREDPAPPQVGPARAEGRGDHLRGRQSRVDQSAVDRQPARLRARNARADDGCDLLRAARPLDPGDGGEPRKGARRARRAQRAREQPQGLYRPGQGARRSRLHGQARRGRGRTQAAQRRQRRHRRSLE